MHPSKTPLETTLTEPAADAPRAAVADAGGIVCAIPARWGSKRLPGKPLRELAGRPLVEHVYRRARAARGLARVVVLTDDRRIYDAVRGFGGEVEMTPEDCASGSDRIAHAARSWSDARAIVNVQGDEPLIDPRAIERLATHLARTPDDPIVTLAAPAQEHELDDPNAVKVVHDHRGYALYFSRARIPHRRDPDGPEAPVLKHVGIYGYQRPALLRLAALEPTPLERAEALEQLRALEHGMAIRVLRVGGAEPGVDTAEDLARAAARLADGK